MFLFILYHYVVFVTISVNRRDESGTVSNILQIYLNTFTTINFIFEANSLSVMLFLKRKYIKRGATNSLLQTLQLSLRTSIEFHINHIKYYEMKYLLYYYDYFFLVIALLDIISV